MIIMPDADMDLAADALVGAGYGAAGERCMAISVAVPVGEETADRLIEKLVPRIEALKVGPYTAGNDIDFGPVVTAAAKANILRLVESGVAQGAKLVVDGRNFSLQGYENGYFVGPHLFDHVTPDMEIYKTEIFGPVLSTVRAASYEEAIGLAMDHEYGNGTAIFTRDGDAARDFANRINIGMVGINVPIPVPLAYHTFGGWKKSGFGDLNQHGPDAFRFYTRTKTVTARWPSGHQGGCGLQLQGDGLIAASGGGTGHAAPAGHAVTCGAGHRGTRCHPTAAPAGPAPCRPRCASAPFGYLQHMDKGLNKGPFSLQREILPLSRSGHLRRTDARHLPDPPRSRPCPCPLLGSRHRARGI
jgi:hypothetical protein